MQKLNLSKLLFFLSVFTLSLGQFAKLYDSRGVVLYAFDLVVGIYAVYSLIYLLIVKKSFVISKQFILFLLFSLVAVFSLLINITTLSATETISSSAYLIRWLIYLVAGMCTFNLIKKDVISVREILTTFFISALFISMVGFVQLVVLPDFTTLDPLLGWDPHKNRLASTFFDPNFTGGYLALCLALAIGTYFSKTYKFTRTNIVLFVFIPLVALFLTFSRSSWGSFAVIVLIIGLFKQRRLLLVGLLFALLAYFAVPRVQTRLTSTTDPSDSAAFRLVSWNNTLAISKDNLLTGVGYNAYRYAQKDYGFFDAGSVGGHSGAGSDSSFLLVLATAGIFGFVLFSAAYFYPTIISYVNKYKGWYILPAMFGGLFVQTQFINAVFFPIMLFLILTTVELFDQT